ncbi:MAG: hypothetical protein D3914_09085, partial [Candidatus Electrothrix sp. LOE2]|nr:hypothetical protein [Candidatus Electrothrix sp. LOE2]
TCVATANSSAFLLRPQRLAVQLAPVVDWLTDMMAASGAGSGKKIQEEVLTLMRSFDVLAACSDVTETQVSGELILKQLPAADKEK